MERAVTEPGVDIGISYILRVGTMPLHFYERPILVPVFANQKKSEDFHFCTKSKNSIHRFFGSEPL